MRSISSHGLVLVVVSAALTATANLLLRHGVGRAGGFDPVSSGLLGAIARLARQPAFVVGLMLYGAAALVWFRVLSFVEVSSSYPVLVGLTFALVCVGAVLAFHESMPLLKGFGILVILAGIILIARS